MFRLDRLLTLYFFYPLVKRHRSAADLKIPILMYHSISDDPEDGVHPYYRLNTSPRQFAKQMKFLSDNNYHVISLSEAVKLLNQPINYLASEPPNSPSGPLTNSLTNHPLNYVVLTFDDGLYDFFETAVTILKANCYTATVFLPAGLMGQKIARHAVMSWDQARQLVGEGVAFGSHSMTHSKLSKLKPVELESELRDSKDKIEIELGQKIDAFSYPYAFPAQDRSFVQSLKTLLIDCGYKSGVTTIIGRSSGSDNSFILKRLPVNGYDDPQLFKAKLEGGYDWLYAGQKIFKKAKRHMHAR